MPAEPVLGHRRDHAWQQRLRLGGELVVAAGEHHGHAEGAGHGGAQGELADRRPSGAVLYGHFVDLVHERVIEHGRQRAGAGVVAQKQGGVAACVDAVHHAQAPLCAADQRHVRRQLVGVEVVALVVGVSDHHLVGAGRQTAVQGRVEVAAHELAGGAPVRTAVRRLLVLADAADALEIDADEHFHGLTPRLGRRPRLSRRLAPFVSRHCGRATLGQLVESSEVIALALEARIAAASAPVLLGEAACSR